MQEFWHIPANKTITDTGLCACNGSQLPAVWQRKRFRRPRQPTVLYIHKRLQGPAPTKKHKHPMHKSMSKLVFVFTSLEFRVSHFRNRSSLIGKDACADIRKTDYVGDVMHFAKMSFFTCSGAVLINFLSLEIPFELRDFLSHCMSKAYNIWHKCGLKARSNSRLVRFWQSQNLTNLELEHELDLRLKKFYKHRPLFDHSLPA